MASNETMARYSQELYEASVGLSSLTDPIDQTFAHKATLQAHILGYSEGDVRFGTEKPKDLGIFRVFPTLAIINWVSPSGELEIIVGDRYLDFHMPKSDDVSNDKANQGYSMMAEYLTTKPEIGRIVGVTYRVMALSAQRNQGFNTEKIELPEEVMRYASAYWQNMMPDASSKHFQSAHIVWQDRETFIEHFGNNRAVLIS